MFELLQNGREGLFISGARDEVDEKLRLKGVKKVWITTNIQGANSCVFSQELDKLSSIIEDFVVKHERSAIFLHKVEPLINRNGVGVIRKFLEKVARTICSKDSYLITFTDPEGGDEELQNLISDLRIQHMLEPISNSLRRKIILLLGQQKEASFTEISKKLQIKDSPKLSFHLKKLGACGIVEQDDERRYHLTRAGEETAASLGKLAEFPGKISISPPPQTPKNRLTKGQSRFKKGLKTCHS